MEAIHKVEDGATFLDVFRWLVDERGHGPRAAYAEGLLAPPRYLPPHFADLAGLGSWLAYSRFLNQLDLQRIEADYAQLL